MKNRIALAARALLRNQRPPLTGTSLTMDADSLEKGADAIGLCECWRAWEASTSSEFLNWLLFVPHGAPSAPRIAVLEDWICFKDDRSELDDRAREVLSNRLKMFRENPSMRIVIGGFTGQSSTIAHGMRIGLRRVLSIRSFLLAHGIEPSRIGIAVRGSYWSVAESSRESRHPTGEAMECRLQVADPNWTLARN